MRYKSFVLSFTLFFILILLMCISCQKKGCTDPVAINYSNEAEKNDNSCQYQDFDKFDLLTNLTNNYILPSIESYKNKVTLLKTSTDLFILSPNIINLNNLRSSWEETHLNWQDIAFLDFGPSEYILLRSQTNTYPIDTSEVNNSILNAEWNFHNATYNDSKGLQALDYLLHKPGYSDLQLVNYYSSNVNAKEYLKAIIDDLMVNINYVNDEWINHKSNFINDFEINNSGFSSNSQGSSISNIINALCLHYEFYVRRGKIGLPLGVFNGFSQQELPHLVECYFSGKSLQNTARCINSIRNFINGSGYINNDNGLGLDDYMNFVNAEYNNMQLSKVIDNQIVTILEELNNYNNPLSDEIMNNKDDLLNSYEELQKLVPFIKVDMTSGLGVLITYQDNDGD